MDANPSLTKPSSRYNDFLFTVICEDPEGTQLSVLSALARTNVDPWEEAERLSSMTKTSAEKALITLFHEAGRHWSPLEEAAIAERVSKLLPELTDAGSSVSIKAGGAGGRLPIIWMVWWGFAIAASILSPHHQAAPSSSTPQSSATPPSSAALSTKIAGADAASASSSQGRVKRTGTSHEHR